MRKAKRRRRRQKPANGATFQSVARQVFKNAGTGDSPCPETEQNESYRSVFISDFHLGSKRSQAEKLAGFLENNRMENLYLVGDIVDGWRFAKFDHWPDSHTSVLNAIFKTAKGGANVVFTPGNHDHLFRAYLGRNVRGIQVHHDVMHETADGRKFWVVHGDGFDKTAYVPDWMFHLADWTNRALHAMNEGYNSLRKAFGKSRKCLVHYLKNTSKHGEKFKHKFARLISAATSERGADGVICGHIHKPENRLIGGVNYINTGDWVDNCTALVEHFDGRMELIRWDPVPGA